MPRRSQKQILAVGGLPAAAGPRLYTLTVIITSGMVLSKFLKKNPVMSRTIQIRGDQTLADLHEAIFSAFDRYDEHLYEFQFGAKRHDPMARRYVHPMALESDFDDRTEPKSAEEATIDSLELKPRQKFLYWFDFGDDWWHDIKVDAIATTIPPGDYPKVIGRVGKSPPQYPDLEEE